MTVYLFNFRLRVRAYVTMASGDQEEVFTLLLTDIDLASGVVDDGHERVVVSSLKVHTHDRLVIVAEAQ